MGRTGPGAAITYVGRGGDPKPVTRHVGLLRKEYVRVIGFEITQTGDQGLTLGRGAQGGQEEPGLPPGKPATAEKVPEAVQDQGGPHGSRDQVQDAAAAAGDRL